MFNNMQTVILTETLNLDIADKLANLNFSKFKDIFDSSTSKRHDDYDLKKEYSVMKNYCSNLINGCNKTTYKYSDNKTIGRLFAKGPSMQKLYNGFRGALCEGYMLDIDICNAHPVFLINLCKQHNIKYNYLNDYINNREAKLQETMGTYNITRAQAKSLFLSCLNDVNIKKFIKGTKKKIKKSFIHSFDKEMTNIISLLYSIYKNDEYYNSNFKPKDSDYKNVEGQFTNLILCDIENKTLQKAITYCIDNKIFKYDDLQVLMFDGFMIKNNVNKSELIDSLNTYFKNDNIKWATKEHNTDLVDQIMNSNESSCDFEGENIIEIIKYINSVELKNKLIKCKGVIYYMGDNTISSNKEFIIMELYDYISEKNYIINDGKKQTIVSKIPCYIKQIIEGVMNKCPKSENFIDDVWDYTLKKLFFKNGYYDFKINKFVEGSFNKTFIKINRDYKPSNNQQLRDEINRRIFYPIFTIDETNKKEYNERMQLYNYFMYSTGHYLAGDVSMKKWTLLQGMRNSGKGIIGDILKNAFSNYVMTTNSSNFAFKKGCNDSQKALSWLIDYQFVRVALTSEISIGENEKLDGNMIKKFTSGGDCLMARKNFQDEMEFKIQSSLIMCCNDCPDIQPSDALEYCDEIFMSSKFISDYENKNITKLKGFKYYLKDDTLKTDFLKDNNIINELTNMFIESYYNVEQFPDRLKKQNQDVNNEDSDYDKINNLFEITNDEHDIVLNQEIKEIMKNNKIKFSFKKVKNQLLKAGASDAKIKKGRGLKCIKIVDDEEEEEQNNDDNIKILNV